MGIELPDILKLKPKHWVSGVVMCLGTIAPGTLILFWFKPSLFESLQLGKVAILAISLTAPVVVLNLIVALPDVLLHGKMKPDSEDLCDPADLYVTACGFAAAALYLSLGLAYVVGLTFKQFCLAVAVTEALLAVWTWVGFWKKVER